MKHVFNTVKTLYGNASYFQSTEYDCFFLQCLDGTARGFGQVVFCNNSLSGVIIFSALMCASYYQAICTLYCAFLTNAISIMFNGNKNLMRNGLLSYNSVLAGAAISAFLDFESYWWAFGVLSLAAPTVLIAHLLTVHILANIGVSALTFPFNGVMVFLLLSARSWKSTSFPTLAMTEDAELDLESAVLKGLSEIFVVDSKLSGLLIFAAMSVCNVFVAIAGLIGSLLGAVGSWLFFDVPLNTINYGLAGYNCALTIQAVYIFIVPSWRSVLIAGLGTFLTLGAQSALAVSFSPMGVPIMTLPFCFATLSLVAVDSGSLCAAN